MQMTLIHQTLGQHFGKMLETPVLAFGDIVLTKQQLVDEIGVGNFVAASRLAHALKRLRITTIDELSQIDPASLYRVKGTGHTQVYVAMCILDYFKVDVAAWWRWSVKGETVQRWARDKRKHGAHEIPALKSA